MNKGEPQLRFLLTCGRSGTTARRLGPAPVLVQPCQTLLGHFSERPAAYALRISSGRLDVMSSGFRRREISRMRNQIRTMFGTRSQAPHGPQPPVLAAVCTRLGLRAITSVALGVQRVVGNNVAALRVSPSSLQELVPLSTAVARKLVSDIELSVLQSGPITAGQAFERGGLQVEHVFTMASLPTVVGTAVRVQALDAPSCWQGLGVDDHKPLTNLAVEGHDGREAGIHPRFHRGPELLDDIEKPVNLETLPLWPHARYAPPASADSSGGNVPLCYTACVTDAV